MRRFMTFLFAFSFFYLTAQDLWLAPKESKNVPNPLKSSGVSKEKGKTLYNKLCWTCHGKLGDGKGPAGKGLRPAPKSFSTDVVQNQKDGELFWKISNGKGMMAPYKHSLKESQIWDLVNYIRSFKNSK